jgi:hypothetical protein
MAAFFADTSDQITLGVQASNQVEVTQFSSTTDQVFMRFFTNNYANTGVDNLNTGVVIGSSNYDKTSTALNNLYFGMLTGGNNIQHVMTMQKDRVGINTDTPASLLHVWGCNVYSSWGSLARFDIAQNNNPSTMLPAFVINNTGNIGVGTEAVSGNTMTIKGTLQVDSLHIGLGAGGNPSLITAQGINAPSGVNYLQYANNSFCNINNIQMNGSITANGNILSSNIVIANTYQPLIGNSMYYSQANLCNITGVFPQQIQMVSQGMASSPAITFQGNNTTGIFQPTQNTLAFSTSGTESFRIDQNGNVGINKQLPNYTLDVNGTIAAPTIWGSNIIQQFANIASYTFINAVTISIGSISPTGTVPFTINFKGNSTDYYYSLNVVSTGYTYNSPTQVHLTSSVSVDKPSIVFPSGSYTVNISATTGGSGYGSYYSSNNLAFFTVGATDSIGAPSVSLLSAPTFTESASGHTYVSGIPYYSNGVTVSFPQSSLGFTNIYNTIDPTNPPASLGSPITYVLNLNGNSYPYSTVFTNFKTNNATNTNPTPLSFTITSGTTSSLTTLPSTVYNINNRSGINNNAFLQNIAYLGSAVSETGDIAYYGGMSINSVTRYSIANSCTNRNAPNISTELSQYRGTPSSWDPFYSPYTQSVYNIIGNVPQGTYQPTLPAFTGSHNYLTFQINASAPLSTFVLNIPGSSAGVISVYVCWASIMPASSWYSAKILYTQGGCGASTDYTANRFPITLPQGLSLSSASLIYVIINFNGSISLNLNSITGLSITNS